MIRFTKHILVFSVLFLYTFEGAIYGSYSFNIILETTLNAIDPPDESKVPQNIRPLWAHTKHIKEDNKSASLFIVFPFLFSENNIFHSTPLWSCGYGLISSNHFFENKDRSPPLS
jgi:hypothetical protein